MELHGTPWNLHEIPWTLHGTPWSSMEFHGSSMETPWNSMEWNFMEFHGVILHGSLYFSQRCETSFFRVTSPLQLERFFICHP